MQDVNRPAHVQTLPEPAGARCPGVEAQAVRVVMSPKSADRISRHRGRWWHLGQGPAIRTPELKRAVTPALDSITLLVHRTVMPSTEQREVRHC